MFKILLPIVFLVSGVFAGGAVATLTTPADKPDEMRDVKTTKQSSAPAKDSEFFKVSNQFVIPIVDGREVSSHVVLTLSLEVAPDARDTVFAREPKLRSAFLRVLFDHANIGGFEGAFTSSEQLDPLRVALKDVAQKELGASIKDVLVMDIARQDVN